MILHLGVIDIPYAGAPLLKKQQRVANGAQTTGDVAGWLEDRYHVMENFYEIHKNDVADSVAKSLQGSLENLLAGGPPPPNPFQEATTQIDRAFKKFLSQAEMEKIGYPGVPTQAALDRRSARFKKRRGKTRRPSFIDTGLYQASFKSWVS